ncbi:hypothetical protein RFI_36328 [Reticulomyxa filosa]|uniref:Uncharacterized protein n=1 Tax=Reticulomyxa filosa TaxID=46433 RepID=X6LIX6_RETFI|nr:hypothetical protein RFI_36328 [Reticulomyxa filosa]|eukprot:ETO01112.1 hypothetical protein RFI_36328 [Reticulomyxa filosa]
MEAQSFEKIVMHSLTFSERKIICRLITGKVGLNDYLYNIQRSESPDCIWCKEEETVEHFLMNVCSITSLLVDKYPDIASRYQCIVPVDEIFHHWGSNVETRH